MSNSSPFRCKFLVLLLHIGFVASAQKLNDMNPYAEGDPSSNTKHKTSEKHKPVNCLEYSGYVVSKETGDPVSNAKLKVQNSDNGLVTILRTDKTGFYKINVGCNTKSKIEVQAAGYASESRIVRAFENLQSTSLNNRIYLTPFESLVEKEGKIEKIKVDSIVFASHDTNDKDSAKLALENVLFTMLKFPEIKIKIESRSNEGNTDISNLVFAYFRTKAARKYLISNGIDADRIKSSVAADISLSKKESHVPGLGLETSFRTGSDFIIVSE